MTRTTTGFAALKTLQHATLKAASILLLTTFIAVEAHAQPGFLPSVIPNKYFPKPVANTPIPTGPTAGFPWPTFYNQRNNGSCYSATLDIDGTSPGAEQIYVWAINAWDVTGYNNAIAYEITNTNGSSVLQRGNDYVGGDIANLNVGLYKTNTGSLHVVVAYCGAGGNINLDDFLLSPGSTAAAGLSLFSTSTIGTVPAPFGAAHIGLDCHDLTSFTVIWEDQGSSLKMKGYDYSLGALVTGPGPVMSIGNPTSRIPDVAMNHNLLTGEREVHIACADLSTSPPQINKYTKNFDDLMTGTIGFTMEDAHSFPAFGAFWDDFILKIDAPDHYSAALSDWSIAYFANDNNKVNVRMCNRGGLPAINTYTVNNGTVPFGLPGGSTFLPDLTVAGNAFPTISYLPTSNGVYVGWYTSFDPSIPPPVNNALYTYTAQTQGYVSVVLDNAGFLRTREYNRVDNDFSTNRIGIYTDPLNPYTRMYYPKVCFSKNNETPKLFAHFISHDIKPNLVWRWQQWMGGAAFLGKYIEDISIAPGAGNEFLPGGPVLGIGYSNAPIFPLPFYSVFTTQESVFISYKQVDWYPAASPLFRTTAMESSSVSDKNSQLSVLSNPFSNAQVFQLQGKDAQQVYTATLYGTDGKQIAENKGNVTELNTQFKELKALAAGTYHLRVQVGSDVQNFKLIKQ